MKSNARHVSRRANWIFTLVATLALFAPGLPIASAQEANDVVVPSGYQVREFASGLGAAVATSVAPNGDLYVLASGFPGSDGGAQPGTVEIFKISSAGLTSKVYSSASSPGLVPIALGIAAIDDDTIFVNDGEGLKHVHNDGSVELLAILPNLGDHGNDHIAFGLDNKLYWGEGSATNSGVVGPDNQELTGWLNNHPDFHDVPCTDVTLSGANFVSSDVRSSDSTATVTTGPFLPFGTAAATGQVVEGQLPCTSSILRMNQDGTDLEAVAWGFRNPFGLAFSPPDSPLQGALVVANNGTEARGSRPVESDGDDLFVVRQGGWYGWPDSLDEQPTTQPRFKPADGPAPPLLLQSPSPDDAISALTHFPKGVSAGGLAFSTTDDFGWRNDLFVALRGSIGLGAQPGSPPGFDVYRVHVADSNGVVSDAQQEIFVRNKVAGPASQSGLNGLEHPSDVDFSPDGKTMYITDLGQPTVRSGRIWAVTRTSADVGGGVGPGPAPAPTAVPGGSPLPATPAPPAPGPTAAPPPAAPASGRAAVTLAGFAFDPMDLTVAAGATVTWTNTDAVSHTVTWDDKSVDSGLFGQGKTFSHTFDTPGTYGYYCIPHGSPGAGMHGTVTVTGR